MDRKTILKHGPGTVFASKVRFGGWHNAVRLADTRIWRHVRHGGKDYYHYTTRTSTDVGTGYLVLRLAYPGSMSDEHHAKMIARLAAVTVTADDLINADGTLNEDAVPAEMRIDILTSRELTRTWADHQAEQDADRAEYEARVEADRARYAADDAARKERAARLEAVREAAGRRGRELSADMARMGIEPGGLYPRIDHPDAVARVEINLKALVELVEMAQRADMIEDDRRDGHHNGM